MNSGVYLITNKPGEKCYVGSTKTLAIRRAAHYACLRNNHHRNEHLQRAWNKHGESAFSFEVLEYCDEGDLLDRENWWIQLLGSLDSRKGYNQRSAFRWEHSEETRAKIAAAKRGKPNSRKGTKCTPETLARMSMARQGKPLSESHRHNLSVAHRGLPSANKGEKKSPEARAKMSAAKKGKPNPHLGYPVSEETRAKLSAAGKGRIATPEARENMSQAQRGRVTTPEVRAKISESLRGKLLPESTKEKLRIASTGRSLSEKAKAKISAAHRGKTKRPCTEEEKAQKSAAMKRHWAQKKATPS